MMRRRDAEAVVISPLEFKRFRSERSSFGVAYEQFLGTHRLDEIGLDRPFLEVDRGGRAGRSLAL